MEVGARFDEPLTDRDLRDRADRRVDWRCENEYQHRSPRDETVDALAWRGVWCPRKASHDHAKRRLRYDDRGGPSVVEKEVEEEEYYSEEEEEEPIGDVVEDAVAAAVAADARHYLELLRIENDEELKALKEEERQACTRVSLSRHRGHLRGPNSDTISERYIRPYPENSTSPRPREGPD